MSSDPADEVPGDNRNQSRGTPRQGGRGGGRGRSSGRTPIGGRSLVSPDGGRGGRGARTPQQLAPISIHQTSGVPFGHVPAYLPGSSSLVEELDKRMLLVLRDGKHLVGTLGSFDQFSNIVLVDSYERRIVRVRDENGTITSYFTDIPLGVFVVRGDSLVLAGEVHEQSVLMKQVPLAEFEKLETKAEPPLSWDFDEDLIA